MPVQTRSASRRQNELGHVEQSTQNSPPSPPPNLLPERTAPRLTAHTTLVEIKVSATGQGTHTRWIRPNLEQSSSPPESTARAMFPISNRENMYQTPSPEEKRPQVVPQTPKANRDKAANRRFPTSFSAQTWTSSDENGPLLASKGKDLSVELQNLTTPPGTVPYFVPPGPGVPALRSPFAERENSTHKRLVLPEASWDRSDPEDSSDTSMEWISEERDSECVQVAEPVDESSEPVVRKSRRRNRI